MKRYFFLILTLALFVNTAFAPSGDGKLRVLNNTAFQVGEYLKYRIHYGIIDAGIAELKVMDIQKKQGREVYHVVGTGRSVGMAEWFFKTRDRYESYIDKESILPWEFIRDVNEDGFIIKRHLIFNHYNQTAKDLEQGGKMYSIPPQAQDMLSSFYYARTFDQAKLKVGEAIPITMFLDHETFPFHLKFLGREQLSTKWGKISCLKFSPLVQEGRVFKEEEGMTLWVSDDANKVPIRLQTELQVGSIKMDLEAYSGLIRPLNFRK